MILSSETTKTSFAELSSDIRKSTDLAKLKASGIDESIDRSKYLSMKECLTCGTPLGKQGSRKFYCHFCYRAVCSACSPLNLIHPESNKEEKICNPCYINSLKLLVLQSGEEYVINKLKIEIEAKEKEIQNRKLLAEELDGIKTNFELEKTELNVKINLKQEEIKQKNLKLKEKKEENARLQKFMDDMINKGQIDKSGRVQSSLSLTPNERTSNCMSCLLF
jgi:FYVE zinc finger